MEVGNDQAQDQERNREKKIAVFFSFLFLRKISLYAIENNWLIYFGFWVIAGGSQGLFLFLHSGIIRGGAWVPYGVPGIEPRLVTCKASALSNMLLILS